MLLDRVVEHDAADVAVVLGGHGHAVGIVSALGHGHLGLALGALGPGARAPRADVLPEFHLLHDVDAAEADIAVQVDETRFIRVRIQVCHDLSDRRGNAAQPGA